MKKFGLAIVISILFSSIKINAQQSPCKTQVDSLQAMFYSVLDKLDSTIVKNDELSKKLEQRSAEIASLKREIEDILKKKKDSAAELANAKKLIADQAAILEKLEAEVKRLSQTKKTNQ